MSNLETTGLVPEFSNFEADTPSMSHSREVVLPVASVERCEQSYNDFRSASDGPIRIGLYGHDLEAALRNPDTVLMTHESDGEIISQPLLVPLKGLEWYNIEYLQRLYGKETEFYYYASPQIKEDEATHALVENAISEKLDTGAVIVADSYREATKASLENHPLGNLAVKYVVERFNEEENAARTDIFAAPLHPIDYERKIVNAPTPQEVYVEETAAERMQPNETDGISLVSTISGEDADRIWNIYSEAFDHLSEKDPMYAGFDEDQLKDLLADPEVLKLVNRIDGTISTLCIVTQGFEQCPWFNAEYFKQNYPEYYETNNIFLFPSIVSDEKLRGQMYSTSLISTLSSLLANRGTSALMAFECTAISTQYIPGKVVKYGVKRSGNAEIEGLDEPVGVIDYWAIHKRA